MSDQNDNPTTYRATSHLPARPARGIIRDGDQAAFEQFIRRYRYYSTHSSVTERAAFGAVLAAEKQRRNVWGEARHAR